MRYLMALCFLLFADTALAQCPYGIPNNPGCVPPDAWPQNQGGQSAQRQPYWVYTWGALAKEMGGGPLGISTGFNTKRQAEQAAIKDCRGQGGKKCKILTSYNHQCVAIAFGKGMSWSRGPDLEVIKREALEDCNALEGEGECFVHYSNCTKPYLVE